MKLFDILYHVHDFLHNVNVDNSLRLVPLKDKKNESKKTI